MAATPPSLALASLLLSLLLSAVTTAAAANSTFADLLKHLLVRGGSLCEELITPSGYPCHEHSVQTKDGFILALQRVSSSSSGIRSLSRGPPVLLQHGLFMSGDCWFLNSREESLGFILADRGFDVWVANVRGTRWSHGHVSLSDRSKAYWDWSWEELALYDLAAMIEYIYQETSSKVNLVGHSQGTIMSLAALTQPEIAKMVKAAALLSPISYLGHVNAPLFFGWLICTLIRGGCMQMVLAMGFHQLNFRSEVGIELLDSVCYGHVDCDNLLASITGVNCCFNVSRVDFYLEYEPNPSSVKNINHLFQMIRHDTFAKYDYGMLKNMRVYGSFKPPAFDLNLVPESLPLWMAYGGTDDLADVTDVQRTIQELPCKKEILYLHNYGHIDFLLSVSAKEDIYGHMIEFFSSWGESSSF